MTQRDAYVAQIKRQLDELNVKMTELDAQARSARSARTEARETYQTEMLQLHQQTQDANAQLAQMMAAGEDSWNSMVTEMTKVRDAFITTSFNYFNSKF